VGERRAKTIVREEAFTLEAHWTLRANKARVEHIDAEAGDAAGARPTDAGLVGGHRWRAVGARRQHGVGDVGRQRAAAHLAGRAGTLVLDGVERAAGRVGVDAAARHAGAAATDAGLGRLRGE
jgi:hypothetical protein